MTSRDIVEDDLGDGTVRVTMVHDLDDLRRELARVSGTSSEAARRMVRLLDAEIRRAEAEARAAQARAKATRAEARPRPRRHDDGARASNPARPDGGRGVIGLLATTL